jgi:hypothetical protein
LWLTPTPWSIMSAASCSPSTSTMLPRALTAAARASLVFELVVMNTLLLAPWSCSAPMKPWISGLPSVASE